MTVAPRWKPGVALTRASAVGFSNDILDALKPTSTPTAHRCPESGEASASHSTIAIAEGPPLERVPQDRIRPTSRMLRGHAQRPPATYPARPPDPVRQTARLGVVELPVDRSPSWHRRAGIGGGRIA